MIGSVWQGPTGFHLPHWTSAQLLDLPLSFLPKACVPDAVPGAERMERLGQDSSVGGIRETGHFSVSHLRGQQIQCSLLSGGQGPILAKMPIDTPEMLAD